MSFRINKIHKIHKIRESEDITELVVLESVLAVEVIIRQISEARIQKLKMIQMEYSDPSSFFLLLDLFFLKARTYSPKYRFQIFDGLF